jgi:hypothetical protein
VGQIATDQSVISALGKELGTDLSCLLRAFRVPAVDTACFKRGIGADTLTAGTDLASRGVMGTEAVATHGLTTATEAGGSGGEHTGGIPLDFTAEGLESTNGLAARGVLAEGREAGS